MKIAMLGDSGVGKTCIIERFINNTFDVSSSSAKGASFKAKTLKSADGGFEIKLMIWDTAGQEIYRSLTPLYYKDADAVIIVYDITNEKSFESLKYWVDEVQQHGKANCIVNIAGNKIDCMDQEKITPMKAKTFAEQCKAKYYITSAKEGTNITEMFNDILTKKYPRFQSEGGPSPSRQKSKGGVKLDPKTAKKKEGGCKC